MSSGHRHHEGFGLNTQALDRLLKNESVQQHLSVPKQINNDYDVPYLGGYNTEGSIIYFDRHLPKQITLKLDGTQKPIDPRPFLSTHESLEKALIDALGYHYHEAHKAATAFERRFVLQNIGPGWWDTYQRTLEPYIKADEHEKLKKVPHDLDLTPYLGDKATFEHLEKFTNKEKSTKKEADYGDGTAKRHCGPDSGWPSNYCSMFRKPNSCTAVRGYIKTRGVCKFYEKAKD